MTACASFFRRKWSFNSWNFRSYIDLQYSVLCSEDRGSSSLCGCEINLSLI